MPFLSRKEIDAVTALSLETAQREAPLKIDSEVGGPGSFASVCPPTGRAFATALSQS